MKYPFITVFVLILAISPLISCDNHSGNNEQSQINVDHLRHLYTDVRLDNGAEVGVLNIYSEYPDYRYTIEKDEGFACVDDASRAIVFLAGYHKLADDPELLRMMLKMTGFILEMQAENGYFYNFIWEDGSINKDYRTSLPEANWWSWRALWSISEAFPHLPDDIKEKARQSAAKLIEAVIMEFLDKPMDTIIINGMHLPNWFPLGTAYDQSALLIVAMISYHDNIQQDTGVLKFIGKLSNGLLLTQKGNDRQFPYYAFLSWNNLWHAYGNIQSYALLKAAALLEREDLVKAALNEVDHFYPFLIKNGIAHHFYLDFTGEDFDSIDYTLFPQIAYGIRPLVFACTEAHEITGDKKYLAMAMEAASWLSGKNPAGISMYDPRTGRCYDGIISDTAVNLNSGAESTIEALLTLQALNKTIRNQHIVNNK